MTKPLCNSLYTAIAFFILITFSHTCCAVSNESVGVAAGDITVTANRDTNTTNAVTGKEKPEVDFLAIADMHVEATPKVIPNMDFTPSKPYSGSPRTNDLDNQTFESMLSTIRTEIGLNQLIRKPEFIIVLGDFASHDRTHGATRIEKDLDNVFESLRKKFSDIPIFYVFGNNDGLKGVNGKFYDPSVTGTDNLRSPYEIATKKGGWLNGFLSTGIICNDKNSLPCLSEQDVTIGCYVAYIRPKLKLITINSMLMSAKLKQNEIPPETDKQIVWLESQLKDAHNKNESVIIASHFPLGKESLVEVKNNVRSIAYDYMLPDYQKQLGALVRLYSKDIIIILSGHSHFEELRLVKEEGSYKVNGVVAIVPALSTSSGNSPGLKTFYLTKQLNDQWTATDYDTLFFVKTKNGISLTKLYNFQDLYCKHKNILDIRNIGICMDDKGLERNFEKTYDLDNPELNKTAVTVAPVVDNLIVITKEAFLLIKKLFAGMFSRVLT
jgi:sphingomyelin phosphodiesterase acid-like 3